MGLSLSILLSLLTNICLLSFTLLPAAISIHRSNETDQLALLEFKAKITHDPLNSWNSSLHFCQWRGVTCGPRHQRVTVLDLRSLKLSGTISPHVGNLSFLRKLFLHNNSFSYEIPPQIGHLRRLQALFLNNNSLTGQIPATISNCSQLVLLQLYNNNLTGEIPVELGTLQKLKIMFLGTNNLVGTLPPSIGNLSSLEELFIYKTKLHGVLPESLGQLMNLRILALSDNQFSGTIPSSIFNLSSIQIIDFALNHLQGNIPMHLDVSFPQLQFFSIGYNQFTGSIPNSISNATNLASFELASNSLTGSVPSLGNLHNLVILSIGINLLGSGEADDLKFLSGLTNATALEILSIGVNNFGGKLPQHIGNLSKKLEMFVIDNNRLIGNLPPGIEALDSLKSLYAAKNNLSGTIPSSIGKLKNLQIIILELNQLSGTIPSSMGNLTNLNEIYFCCNKFQGMIPSSLANCKKLITIDLSDNNLTGPIPQNIFRLSSLSKGLDLSHNHLNGSLPIEVGNLKQLGLLDLQHNKLSGEVPITLGSCESLEQLDMSDNLFQGSVPSSLRSLRGIRDLNLSRNNLSGNIPKFLTGFSSLELLDISFNNFEGMVPVEGIFKNATVISVQGNSNLCGGIRDFGLPACKSEQPKRILRKKFRIIISAVSALVGAGLLLTCLFLWRSRKRKQDSTSSSLENALLRLSYQTLLKATNEFSRDNLIGSGGFGSVYKGILDDGRVIAVKVVNLMRRGASKSFIAECDVLRSVRHRNLVKILTACSGIDYRGDDFKALVYEFMDNGSLDDWLHPSTTQVPRTLDVLQRLNIVIDVACALEYLHYHSGTPIVHCDLKPSNVLLDKEMTAHVSDFGLVKFLFDKELDSATNPSSSIGARGTIGYCPPEYGMGSDVSTSGDVFSFGVLVLEMFTGKRPTDEMFKEGLSLHSFVKNGLSEQVTEIIDCNLLQMKLNVNAASNHNRNFGYRGNNKFIECIISVCEIGISCSSELPQERMSISDVVVHLSSLRNKLLSGTRGNRERQVASSLQRPGGAQG